MHLLAHPLLLVSDDNLLNPLYNCLFVPNHSEKVCLSLGFTHSSDIMFNLNLGKVFSVKGNVFFFCDGFLFGFHVK